MTAFEPIVTEYELTPAELAATDRVLFRRTGAYRVLLGVNVVLLIGAVLARSGPLASVLVAEAVGLGFLFYVQAPRRWRRVPAARVRRRLVLDDDGVQVTTTAGTEALSWAGLHGIGHHGRSHYLFTGAKSALPIPDRALTPEQQARLASLAGRVASTG